RPPFKQVAHGLEEIVRGVWRQCTLVHTQAVIAAELVRHIVVKLHPKGEMAVASLAFLETVSCAGRLAAVPGAVKVGAFRGAGEFTACHHRHPAEVMSFELAAL